MDRKIQFKNGPSFHGFLSTISGIATGILVLAFILLLVNEPAKYLIEIIACVGAIPIFLMLFLQPEGIIIDLDTQEIIYYRKVLFFQKRMKRSLSDYCKVVLAPDRYTTTGRTPTGNYRNKQISFDIMLESKDEERRVVLIELMDYQEAKDQLKRIAAALSLPSIDHFASELERSRNRIRR